MDAETEKRLLDWLSELASLHEERRQIGPAQNEAMRERTNALWDRIITLRYEVMERLQGEDEWTERKILDRLNKIEQHGRTDDPSSSEGEGGAPVPAPIKPVPPTRSGRIAQPMDDDPEAQT